MIEKHEDEIEEDELELYEHYRFIVDKGQSPIRVDKFLTDKVAFATRSRVQQAIDSGSIKVNGENTKGSYKIKPEDDIQVLFEKPRRDTILSMKTNTSWW
jgi:23S rRNA pseudouridine1911/1915/1917 synthase